jgi:tetratricopeptide (TPR) repeat protein
MRPRLLVTSLLAAVLLIAACSTAKSYIERGDALFAKEQYADAALQYRKALKQESTNAEAYYRLALVELKQQRLIPVIQLLERAVTYNPVHPEATAMLGDLLWTAYMGNPNRPDDPLARLRTLSANLLSKNAKSLNGIRFQAYLAVAADNPSVANTLFTDANALRPNDAKIILPWARMLLDDPTSEARGVELVDGYIAAAKDPFAYDMLYTHYMDKKSFSQAEDVLKRKRDQWPDVGAYQVELALHYFKRGDQEAMKQPLVGLLGNRAKNPEGRLNTGDFFVSIQQYKQAEEQFVLGGQEDAARRPIFQKRLTGLYLTQGRTEDALKLIDERLRQEPADIDMRFARGVVLLSKRTDDNLAKAREDFKAVLTASAKNAAAHYYLGLTEEGLGRVKEAQSEYQEALRIDVSYLSARYALAELCKKHENYRCVLQQADAIIEAKGRDPVAMLLRAQAMMGAGDISGADQQLMKVTRDAPSFREAQLGLGQLRLQQGRLEEAEAIFQKLSAAATPDVRPLDGLARVYAQRGELDRAMRMWESLLAKNPNSIPAREGLAAAALRAGKYDVAILQWRQVLVHNPKSLQTQVSLVGALLGKRDFIGAAELCKQMYTSNPGDVSVAGLYAQVLAKADRKKEAEEVYRQTIDLAPGDHRLMVNLAALLAERDAGLDEALKFAERARGKSPDDPKCSEAVGYILLKKKSYDRALQVYTGLADKYRNQPMYRYQIAWLEVEKGDRESARMHLKKLLQERLGKEDEARVRELLGKVS